MSGAAQYSETHPPGVVLMLVVVVGGTDNIWRWLVMLAKGSRAGRLEEVENIKIKIFSCMLSKFMEILPFYPKQICFRFSEIILFHYFSLSELNHLISTFIIQHNESSLRNITIKAVYLCLYAHTHM